MQFRSNVSEWYASLPPWGVSALVHGVAVLVAVGIAIYRPSKKITVEMSIIEKAVEAPPKTMNLTQPQAPPKKPPPPKRAVFGMSRKAITASETDTNAEAVKQGNTVTKDPDSEKLKDSDADSLPIPADEFMVSSMPVVEQEVRAIYPPEAKQKGIQGVVVMDVLVDAEGKVRDVQVVSGLGMGLDQAAQEAMKQFKFKPARIESQSVAVRIRYTYRFELEK